MKLSTRLINCFWLLLVLPVSQVNAMQSIEEESLRHVSGQSGMDLDLNFKGTIGRTYFETEGNTLNIRNFSIDTDGSNDDAINPGTDRPIKMVLDLVTRGTKSGLSLSITEINDLDLRFDQINVNGDQTADSIVGQMHSFGGLALTNINDNGGITDINVFARGASGEEGLQLEVNLPETLSMRFDYIDYGDDDLASIDDFTFGGDLTLNNFSIANSIDLTTGQNAAGEEIGGLHIGVITQTGDMTLSNVRAGDQLGTMGRLVVNGYTMTPDSYLTIQGK
ncbi:MAG: hypothetical protein KBT75_06825 [Oleispira antarctica]|uniref:DUF6160 domain-containing protein n=1 Tax=Oleispira antarctica RB-8 TaxID=698738 RepID=R4YNZ8_OLEAN|nr:hypothetical protein [Oleispira antarctica]MBQ0792831.1 hypothetical protein [Oleispira antarctica]CCK76550.1 hypothetical protein OLEAN_C23740 [Oleispira antarctica RB-8]